MANCNTDENSEKPRTGDKQALVYPLRYVCRQCDYTALTYDITGTRTCGLAWVRVRNLRVTLSFTPCTPFKCITIKWAR